MNRNNSDRNLLFGILALQMDFVRKEQLIEAMQAWVLDKEIPVAEHLIRLGALRPEHRQLLEPLVTAQVQRCEVDADTSITSERAFGTIREALRRIEDRDLEESIERIASRTRFDPPDQTKAPSDHRSASTRPAVEQRVQPSATRFTILRPHAEGGLGQVYIAKDEELSREVALKEIKPSKADNLDNRARFTREAEITGGLEHPGIVPVYGLGVNLDGRPFYAMRFIRGDSLKDAIQAYHSDAPTTDKAKRGQRNIDLRRLLQRFISVCETIDYAHSRGIMHRDIKPSNIMLGRHGETLVVDWGLAKPLAGSARNDGQSKSHTQVEMRLDALASPDIHEGPLAPTMSGSESMPTLDGSALGTPPYMSPEQASGRLDLLGQASDIFSLGATLFAILTGRAPYKASTLSEILRQAQACSYPLPRSLNREIPAAIEAVCLKAMRESIQDRYSSAKALAEDIERFLADEPVAARKESWPERLGRFVRHNRTWISSAAAIALIICVSALTSIWLVHQARQAKELSDVRLLAESQKAKSHELLALTNQMTSRRVAKTHNWIAENQRDLDTAARLADTDDVRLMLRNEISAIQCALDLRWRRTVVSSFDASRLAFTSTGDHVARGANLLHTGQVLVQILDPRTGAIERKLSFFGDLAFTIAEKGGDGIKALAFTPGDRYLLAGSRSGWIYQWSLPDYQLVRKWRAHSKWVNQFLFASDAATFWTCSRDRTVKRWNIETGQQLAEYEHADTIPSIGVCGTTLLIGGAKAALLDKDALTLMQRQPHGSAKCCAIAALGKHDALAICQNKAIIVQSDCTLAEPQSFLLQSFDDFHSGEIQGMRVASGSQWVATFDDERFRLIDFASGSVMAQPTSGNTIFDVQFHPTRPLVYVASGGNLEEYSIHQSVSTQLNHISPFPIQAIALDVGGQHLASISHQPGKSSSASCLTLGEPLCSEATHVLNLESSAELHLASDAEGKRLFIADQSEDKIFEVDTTSRKIHVHAGNDNPKNVNCSDQSGHCLFVSRAPHELGQFLRGGPYQISRLISPDRPAESVWKNQFSNVTLQRSDLFALAVHEHFAAFTSHDNHLRLLDTSTGQMLWDVQYDDAFCNAIALTSDHRRIIAGDSLGKLHMFFPESQREPIRQLAHQESICAVALSESGWLVSGSQDRWIKLWQMQDGGLRLICEMGPFPLPVAQLHVSRDGSLCAILFQRSRAVHVLLIDELVEQFRSRHLLKL